MKEGRRRNVRSAWGWEAAAPAHRHAPTSRSDTSHDAQNSKREPNYTNTPKPPAHERGDSSPIEQPGTSQRGNSPNSWRHEQRRKDIRKNDKVEPEVGVKRGKESLKCPEGTTTMTTMHHWMDEIGFQFVARLLSRRHLLHYS